MPCAQTFDTVIVGGGPAGLAILLAAHKRGTLQELLKRGLLVLEQSSSIGAGQIGNYAINSDSTGDTFVDPLRVGDEETLHNILNESIGRRVAAIGPGAVPLTMVGELQAAIGDALHRIIERYPNSSVWTRSRCVSTRKLRGGGWQLQTIDQGGISRTLESRHVVLATGAAQPQERLARETIAGTSVVGRWHARLIQSGDVVRHGGLARVADRLHGIETPRVAILGGSTSAMAVAFALLNRLPNIHFDAGGVTIYHRRPLRVYYPSTEEAIADDYTEFGIQDLCPITRRVFRFAGMRLDSRELLMQVRGIGGRPPEPRLRLCDLRQDASKAIADIDASHLVVAAFGYRPNALPVLDEDGSRIPLFAENNPQAPLVDDCCRVMDEAGTPIDDLFAIGLAAGFVPRGNLGGEPSFRGQANGLWLWQNDVGAIIVNFILSERGQATEKDGIMVRSTCAGTHQEPFCSTDSRA